MSLLTRDLKTGLSIVMGRNRLFRKRTDNNPWRDALEVMLPVVVMIALAYIPMGVYLLCVGKIFKAALLIGGGVFISGGGICLAYGSYAYEGGGCGSSTD